MSEEGGKRVYVCPRCSTQVRDNHLSIACDICDEWHHVQCVGISKGGIDAISHFMCRQCRSDGNLGSNDAGWHMEGVGAPPPQEESSESSESSDEEDDGQPAERGTRYAKVEYDNGSEFWGELYDGVEYIGELVPEAGRPTQMVKMVAGKMLTILWEDMDYAVSTPGRLLSLSFYFPSLSQLPWLTTLHIAHLGCRDRPGSRAAGGGSSETTRCSGAQRRR